MGGLQKEFFDSRFAVRKSVPDESQVARQVRIGRYGVMRFWIQSVIDRQARLCSKFFVVRHHGWSAAISENSVVFADDSTERIPGIRFKTRERCWSVYIPEYDSILLSAAIEHLIFQTGVVGPDATVLDDDVGAPRLFQQTRNIPGRLIDKNLGVGNLCVSVLLSIIDRGLRKCDLMTQALQILVHAAVIGRSAIPIRGRKTRAKDEDVHRPNSWQISSNCRARWRHV